MKRFIFVAALLLSSSPVFADEKPTCNVPDPKAVCDVKLTTADLNFIANMLENTEVPHSKWGPWWNGILQQIADQKPKDAKPAK